MPRRAFTPPLSSSAEVRFFELDDAAFELMCCALHERQPGIHTAYRWGPDGQAQFGVDHIANRADGTIEVGQCKAKRAFPKSQVDKAIAEFLDHWDTEWSTRRVTKFVLFVGCDIKSADAQRQLETEERRFADLGIAFEWWDSARLVERLREHRALVQHFAGALVPRLFPTVQGPLDRLAADAAAGVSTSREMFDIVSQTNAFAPDFVERVRRDIRHGRSRDAESAIVALRRNGAGWEALSAELRARIVRLQASIALNRDDVSEALARLREAEAIDGTISPRHEALIALETAGPEAALAKLGDARDLECDQVRAVALLRMDRAEDALAALAGGLATDRPDPETLRLQALAMLALDRRDEAVACARRAVAPDPEADAPRRVLAAMLYNAGLASGAPPAIGSWPEPVAASLVRDDDEGQARLREAADLFERLATDAPDAAIAELLTWQLAAVVGQRGSRDAAQRLLDAALKRDPSSPGPLTWAIATSLTFDAEAAAANLEARLGRDPNDLEALLVRVILFLEAGQPREAARRLSSVKAHFDAAGLQDRWEYWSLLARSGAGQPLGKAQLARHPQLALRAALSVKGRKPQAKALTAVATDPDVPLALRFQALERLGLRGEWEAVASAIGAILDASPTAEIANLAALAYHNTGNFDAALAVLERTGLFAGARLPSELERLRSACLAHSGRLTEAAAAATQLIAETRHAADVTNSLEMLMRAGRHGAAAEVYRKNAALLRTPSRTQLKLATLVARRDPATAAAIVDDLLAHDLPDEFVSPVLMLAMKLNASQVQRALTPRLEGLAAAPGSGIRRLDMKRAATLFRAAAKQHRELWDTYRAGGAPVYLLAQGQPAVLPRLYLQRSDEARARGGAGNTPLLVRQGGDGALWPERATDVRLFADLTGLLTADWLSLLDRIETHLAPVRLCPGLMEALAIARIDAEDAQPSLTQAHRRVLELADAGDIEVLPADGIKTWLVGGDDRFRATWSVDAASGSRALNPRRLFLALKAESREAAEALSRIELELGSAMTARPAGPVPRAGARIVLEDNLAATFEQASALDLLLRVYDIAVVDQYVEWARRLVAEREAADQLAARLERLEARLARGIEAGVYRLLPSRRSGDDAPDPATQAFFDLIGRAEHEAGQFWIDDRLLTSVRTADVAVVSTPDLVDALCAYGVLDTSEALRLRLELRRAQYLFIAPTEGELAYHLRRAPFRSGTLGETDALVVLRRHTALTFLHADTLNYTPGGDQIADIGELALISRFGRAVSDAIAKLWNDPTLKPERCAAASDWLLAHIDPYLRPTLPAGLLDTRAAPLLGVHLAGLLMVVMQLDWPGLTDAAPPRVGSYIEWAWGAIADHLEDEGTASAFYASLANLVCVSAGHDGSTSERRIWRALAGRLFNALPEPVRDRLLDNSEVRTFFGVPSERSVTIGGFSFREDRLWTAFGTAAGQGDAVVTDVGKRRHRVRARLDASPPSLDLCPPQGKPISIDPTLAELAGADGTRRRSVLRAELAALDLTGLELDTEVEALASLEPATTRLQAFEAVRARTLPAWLDATRSVLRTGRFSADQLRPPSTGALMRYLHIAPGDCEPDLEAAAQSLVDRYGVREAVQRLSALPVNPPLALVEAAARLPLADREKWLTRLERSRLPPWEAGWGLRLLAPLLAEVAGGEARLQTALGVWLSTEAHLEAWALLRALALWLDTAGADIDGWRSLDAHRQLVGLWALAGTLAREILVLVGETSGLTGWLLGQHEMTVDQLLADDRPDHHDRASPTTVSVARLQLAAAAGLAPLFERGGEAHIAALRELLIDAAPGVPKPALLRLSDIGTDRLATTLAADLGHAFAFVDPRAEALRAATLRQSVAQLFDAPDPGRDVTLLHYLFLLSRPLPLDAPTAERLAQLIEATSFVALHPDEPPLRAKTFRVACELAVHSRLTAVAPHLRTAFEALLDAAPDDPEAAELSDLIEAGAALSRLAEDAIARAGAIGAVMERVAAAKPSMSAAMADGALRLAAGVRSGAGRALMEAGLRICLQHEAMLATTCRPSA